MEFLRQEDDRKVEALSMKKILKKYGYSYLNGFFEFKSTALIDCLSVLLYGIFIESKNNSMTRLLNSIGILD